MPDEESWRSESAYTYIDQLNAEELAWEFLRRNPEYRAGYHELLSAGHMTWEAATNFASRWGLRFRRRPRNPRHFPTGLLVGPDRSGRDSLPQRPDTEIRRTAHC
ncbi:MULTISPECIES: transcriptional regulator domain-containing protein [Sphingomonadales]|uniref:transcriptional regulator domain-containing protein n=1 Tax=Sphingomonadales TaxID=204457 RepID=UPI001C84D3A6